MFLDLVSLLEETSPLALSAAPSKGLSHDSRSSLASRFSQLVPERSRRESGLASELSLLAGQFLNNLRMLRKLLQ